MRCRKEAIWPFGEDTEDRVETQKKIRNFKRRVVGGLIELGEDRKEMQSAQESKQCGANWILHTLSQEEANRWNRIFRQKGDGSREDPYLTHGDLAGATMGGGGGKRSFRGAGKWRYGDSDSRWGGNIEILYGEETQAPSVNRQIEIVIMGMKAMLLKRYRY